VAPAGRGRHVARPAGCYSLDAQSPDEQLTRDLLIDGPPEGRPAVTVVVVDTAHLARSLYLVSQLREHPQSVVVALTMTDVAARRGVAVDTAALEGALGVPVVALDPRRRDGVDRLRTAVAAAWRAPAPPPRHRTADADSADELAVADERFAWVDEVTTAGSRVRTDVPPTATDRVDRWVTAPVVGPALFLVVTWVVFELTTTVAAPSRTSSASSSPVRSPGW
jgi:ferrous iron transport protein B